MKKNLLIMSAACFIFLNAFAQEHRNSANDGDWSMQHLVLKNTAEAVVMIRAGDIDNLSFGWEQDFIPFSGRSTAPHPYPWNAKDEDAPGTDRIMVPSSYKSGSEKCGIDGYTSTTQRPVNMPRPIAIALDAIKNITVDSAALQLFVDDFQSKGLCSKFQVKLNGQRFIEMEKILNALDQTGPIGKIINVKIPSDLLPVLKTDSLNILIDDPVTGAGDGFAIDFVKLFINPKPYPYTGTITGIILDDETGDPIKNAVAEVRGFGSVTTDDEGHFIIHNIPAGLNIVNGSARGYASAQGQADVIAGETGEEITISLTRSGKVTYNNTDLQEGDKMVMKNVQFELASANLTAAGKQELDKLAAFMNQNATVEIFLSGYTSNDGTDAFNKTLSMNRVKSCKTYLIAKGIDEGRIEVMGYGSANPIAPNDTEQNRAKNRRVEMKITKL